MSLVAIGLLVATLQVAGTFNPHKLFISEHDALKAIDLDYDMVDGRFSRLRSPFHHRWNHPAFPRFQKFPSGRFHRFPVNGKSDFEYQLIPSRWVNNVEESKTTFQSETSLGSTVSPSSRLRIPEALRAKRPADNQNVPLQRSTPKVRQSSVDEDILHTSVLTKTESRTDAPKGMLSSGLRSHVQSTGGPKESVLTSNSSKTTFLSREITSKTATAERKAEENLNVAGVTDEIILTDKKVTENAHVDYQEGKITNLEAETDKNTVVNGNRNELKTDGNPTTEVTSSEITIVDDKKNENTTFDAKTSEISTVEDKRNENIALARKTSKITTVTDEIREVKTDFQLNDESVKLLSTGNQNKSGTTAVSEHSVHTERTGSYTLNKAKLPDNNKREDTSTSQSDLSSSTGMLETTDFSISTTGKTSYSIRSAILSKEDAGSSTSLRTQLKSSKGEFAAEDVPAIPEHLHVHVIPEHAHDTPGHVIRISSLKTAKIVISSVFLVSGLIAIAVLAVYWFREKRRAVQYDQLTLLP